MNLVYREKLLQQLADELKLLEVSTQRAQLRCIEVTFVVHKTHQYKFTLAQAVDVLANDQYWDERGNWANANKLTIEI